MKHPISRLIQRLQALPEGTTYQDDENENEFYGSEVATDTLGTSYRICVDITEGFNPPRREETPREGSKCAICDQPYERIGNNPEPLLPYSERVCDDCNIKYVIPARLGAMIEITTHDGRSIIR